MKRLRELAIVLVMIVGAVLFVHYGRPRYWGDFTGRSEAEVREQLGEPFRDSRDGTDNDPAKYTLGWYQGFEVGLFLTFKDGVVVSQELITR